MKWKEELGEVCKKKLKNENKKDTGKKYDCE